MSTFQIVVLGVFGVTILFAVLLFGGFLGGGGASGGSALGAEIIMWGTYPRDSLVPVIDNFATSYGKTAVLDYSSKDAKSYERTILETLARGVGPDLILLPSELSTIHSDKVLPFSYENISQRSFIDSFVDAGQAFLTPFGIVGLPLVVDPLVVYYNKDIFSVAGISKPPVYWDELINITPILTKKDSRGIISQSAIALGGYGNVSHAKEIISSMVMQVGDPIAILSGADQDTGKNKISIVFGSLGNYNYSPTDSAIRFFSQFGMLNNSLYTWNGSLPMSRDQFLSGKLAMYIGYASEFNSIKIGNPHLNFDVAMLPQMRPQIGVNTVPAVYGKVDAVSVLKTTLSYGSAQATALILSSPEFSAQISSAIKLPSARRDVLSAKTTDPYLEIFNRSALISKTWPDPSPEDSNAIFKEMVETILVGASGERDAVVRASNQLRSLTQ